MNEMTLNAIAGFCNERVLWKILIDLSTALLGKPAHDREVVVPEKVIIHGDDFLLCDEPPQKITTEFYPPEGMENYGDAGIVWSLGALVCYASSGHYVFGGRGGTYQHSNPNAGLPTLRKEHSALTPIIKRCLCYSPSQRISLGELHSSAVKGLEANEQKVRTIRRSEPNKERVLSESMDDVWPEKMV